MKAKQLREMAAGELEDKLLELQRKLFDMRSQAVTEKLENCHSVKNTRREIARVLTVLNEK
ncbi:MAG: 50S ribosomal protein L29 [Planctomycetes bacterium]|nr:50S ribosomal protein L29 [Planctomycetota bacterium]MCH8218086.1 50S ribosomal protein L29 [Planctomycetota bacterium]